MRRLITWVPINNWTSVCQERTKPISWERLTSAGTTLIWQAGMAKEGKRRWIQPRDKTKDPERFAAMLGQVISNLA